jgi:hypothetical protein
MTDAPEDIWAGDLFGRKSEAVDIIGFLESVANRATSREDGHAYVLAVDAPYGEGKSFFLRRFAEQMKLNHPVAFVDAWTDDLEDEPLVALAATLERALEPYLEGNAKLKAGLSDFCAKAGWVAKIAAMGALKRGLGFIVSHSVAEVLSAGLSGESEVLRDIDKEAIKAAPQAIIDGTTASVGGVDGSDMKERIARFREGQGAIAAMKASLAYIVNNLEGCAQAPIVVVVDELDRCRPTYAIKLLEEIKHLFDVPGMVFVLGMHGEQLAHSVAAAYGSKFDATSYLKRFINRRYILNRAALHPLLEKIVADMRLELDRLEYPSVLPDGHDRSIDLSPTVVIASYMDAYGLVARDAFEFMDILQTCLALTKPHLLHAPYLFPLIILQMKRELAHLPTITRQAPWKYVFRSNTMDGAPIQVAIQDMANAFQNAQGEPLGQAFNTSGRGHASYAYERVSEMRRQNLPAKSYALDNNYHALLRTVARFTSEPIVSTE